MQKGPEQQSLIRPASEGWPASGPPASDCPHCDRWLWRGFTSGAADGASVEVQFSEFPNSKENALLNDPETALMAHCFDEHYRESSLSKPILVNWKRFERMVKNNKLSLLVFDSVLGDSGLVIPEQWRERFRARLDHELLEGRKVAPSVQQMKSLVADTPYVLVKTFRPFPYFTHDLDILVEDPLQIGAKITEAGIPWEQFSPGIAEVEEPQWLHLEFYYELVEGIDSVDRDLILERPRAVVWGGVPTLAANPTIEVATLIADCAFRLYELKFGDMVYIYTLAEQTDWDVLATQATKHGWHNELVRIIGMLNAVHRDVYASPSPIEPFFDSIGNPPTSLPYVQGWVDTYRALRGQGRRNLMKLGAYVSVRLKQQHDHLHWLYLRLVQEPIGGYVLRHLYRRNADGRTR